MSDPLYSRKGTYKLKWLSQIQIRSIKSVDLRLYSKITRIKAS